MTDGIRRAMKELTDHEPIGCPWRALHDPFVVRVLAAMPFFESGQLAYGVPQPSHRLLAGMRHYHSAVERAHSRQLERERIEREGKRQPLPMRGGRR